MTAPTSWAGALSATLLAAALSAPASSHAQSCDPTRQSCVPPGGGTGGGGGGGSGGGRTGAGTGGTCTAPPGGNPGSTPACGSGPATRSGSAPSTGAGNPINLVSGNKYQQEIDLPAMPGVLGIELVRHYNSLDAHRGLTGANWRISYEAVLYDFGRSLQIVQADGRRLMFERPTKVSANATHDLCTAADPSDGQVRIEQDAQGRTSYHWRWSDGRTLVFAAGHNGGHPLQSITAASGEQLTLTYAPSGELVAVRDPQGRTLRFLYDAQRQLGAIQTPLYELRLRRDAQYRLIEVSTVAQDKTLATRKYHHEAERQNGHANALTGISLVTPDARGKSVEQRLSTYAYDARGRAVLSTKTDGIEKIEVQYLEPPLPRQHKLSKDGEVVPTQFGLTILSNSLGHKSRIKSAIVAGSYRLIEFTGAGCSTCPEPNRRYGYNAAGQLIAEHQLDADGKVQSSRRFAYDGYGRLTREMREGNERTFARYEYADIHYPDGSIAIGQQPVLIARPSVIPGKEHVTRIDHNAHGQLTQVIGSGYSPTDDKGERSATLITRTTRYSYSRINGRSVLTQIDGPLANGPKASPQDSDVTTLQWDERASVVTAIVQPGGFKSEVGYDDAARLHTVRNDEGTQSRYYYSAAGQLAKLERSNNGSTVHTQTFDYDAQGRLVETAAGAGSTPKLQTRLAYDSADRLLWRAHALGWAEQWRRDSEGRVVEEGRYSSRIVQSSVYEWNDDGSLKAVRDNAGRRVVLPAAATLTPVGTSPVSPSSVRPEVSKGERVPGTQHLADDFGRVVLTRSADSGETIRQFDAADRLIAMRDALNNEARYEYDVAGRIIKQSAQANNQAPIVTQWRYQGRRLIELSHPTQSERFAYDAQGQRSTRSVTLGGHTATTHYERDANGELTATTLPDGSRIAHERNGQGQITALTRAHVHTEWLRGFEQKQVLAKDFERDLVGLARYTAGNGIEASFIRSREGTLARVLYRQSQPSSLTAGTNNMRLGQAIPLWRWEQLLGISAAHAATPAHADAGAPQAPMLGALGQPQDPQALIDHRYLWDARGNLLLDQQRAGQQHTDSDYAYDQRDRVIVASTQASQSAALQPVSQKPEATQQTSYYLHDAQGRRVLAQEAQQATRRIAYEGRTNRWASDADIRAEYDAGGQPKAIGTRRFDWDAHGRLLQVRDNDKTLASYQYSHRGQRIEKKADAQHTLYLYDEQSQLAAELDDKGRVKRQYIYAASLPIAVIDGDAALHQDTAAWLQAFIDLGHIARSWVGAQDNTAWLHTNHLGAPEAATDGKGQLIWQARYSASGRAKANGNYRLNLRLPGQYEDAETGLHYNNQRYYDPERGQYLSPDALAQAPGYPDGPNPYAYVNYNPLRYVDPSGLILFAFDGTGNTNNPGDLAELNNGLSNVWQFRQLYDDGSARYVTGVGTRHRETDAQFGGDIFLNWGNTSTADLGGNFTGPARIERMLAYFNAEAELDTEDSRLMDIDIIGFSRGAAQARDFANRINANTRNGQYRYTITVDGQAVQRCQMINFRFMGLWDTVLSTNLSGRGYNMNIVPGFQYVAQAVALNEYRGDTFRRLPNSTGAFPLESVMGGAVPIGQERIERGFIGAHADIGGGFADQENALPLVTLNWMVEQARNAGVRMLDPRTNIPSNPVIHDKSDNQYCVGGPGCSEDRQLHGGSGGTQRRMTGTGMTYADTGQFIRYYPADINGDGTQTRTPRANASTGTVDMARYLQWLRDNGYELGNLKVQ